MILNTPAPKKNPLPPAVNSYDASFHVSSFSFCRTRENVLTKPIFFLPGSNSTDSEACGIGWKPFRDSCYKMITSVKTWRQGFEHCESAGSQLVKVTDQEELTYIYFTFVKPLDSGSAWIGLSLKNGSFYWTDGSKPGYKNWNYGEPNNFNGREHCVEIYVNNGKWNDIPCFVKRPFVCERGVYFLNNTDHFDVTRKAGSVGVELNHGKLFWDVALLLLAAKRLLRKLGPVSRKSR